MTSAALPLSAPITGRRPSNGSAGSVSLAPGVRIPAASAELSSPERDDDAPSPASPKSSVRPAHSSTTLWETPVRCTVLVSPTR
eukprot:77810-Pleurochrysis_carterae.AAC.1